MDFEQAENYLSSLLKFGIDLSLKRVEKYLRDRNYPWEEIRFIHVGGTNGKGSTSGMIASVLQQSGYRVGLYSSPHTETYRERISVMGNNITSEIFAELATEIAFSMEGLPENEVLTEFEFLTVMAFEYFRLQQVDAAVMEVGMGGKYDATNVIPCPKLSVITNVSMDHMQHLGYTVRDIAFEKAGIIKAGGSLVTAEQSMEIRGLLRDKCQDLGAEFFYIGDSVCWSLGEVDTAFGKVIQKCSLTSNAFDLHNLQLQMPGMYQVINATTALLAVQVLLGQGFHVSVDQLRQGLESVKLPGRFEILCNQPLVILDVAHNVAGVQGLKDTLLKIANGRKLVLITGLLDDKEQEKIAEAWGAMPYKVVVTRPDSHHSVAWEQFARYLCRYQEQVCLIEDIEEAVCYGWQLADKESILCVTGSFYLLRRARKQLQALIDKTELQFPS